MGLTPEFTVGVWVGNLDGTPRCGVSGVDGAGPILNEIFLHLHLERGTSPFRPAETLCEVWIHPLLGVRVPPTQPGAVREWADLLHLPLEAEAGQFTARGIRFYPQSSANGWLPVETLPRDRWPWLQKNLWIGPSSNRKVGHDTL